MATLIDSIPMHLQVTGHVADPAGVVHAHDGVLAAICGTVLPGSSQVARSGLSCSTCKTMVADHDYVYVL